MILQILSFVYYILVLLLPLLFSPYTSELFELNKIVLVYGSAIFAGALYTLYVIIHAPKIHMPKWLGLALLVFLTSQIVSTILSVDMHTSLFGFYGRFNGGLLSTLAYTVLFFVASQIATRTFVVRLIIVSLCASVLVMVWGILAKFGADPACIWLTSEISNTCWSESFKPAERMFATLGQPNWLATYLGIHFFLATSIISIYWRTWNVTGKKAIFWFSAIGYLTTAALCIYWTGSRSGLLGLVSGCAMLGALFLARRSKPIFYGAIVTAVLVSATALLYVFGVISGSVLDGALQKTGLIQKVETPNASVVVTDSAEIRRIVWEGAVKLAYKYPVFGTGVETFGYMYPSVRPDAHNATSEWDFLYHKAHNEFLNYAATTGFFGLFSYVFLCLCVIWLAWRRQTIFAFSLAASVVSQLVSNFFGFSTTNVSLWFFLSAAVLAAESQTGRISLQTAPVLTKLKSSSIRRILGGILASVWLLLLIPVSGFYLADLLYSQSQIDMGSEDYGGALGKLNVAESMFAEPVYEDQLAHLFGITAAAAVASSEVSEEEKTQYIDLFKYYNANSIVDSPKNITFWRTRARGFYGIYLSSQQKEYLDLAREAAEEAIKLAPNDPRAYQFLALITTAPLSSEVDLEKKKNIVDEALALISKAKQLKPDFRDAYDLEAEVWASLQDSEKQIQTYKTILKVFGPDTEVQNKLQELQN